MITIELNSKESLLLQAAIRAEIQKGSGTFLSDNEVIKLAYILKALDSKDLA